ncbi:MAG: LLM class flavin-dependent oxidoreductase [Actinomycetota bacterium]|nr:LLM class flavin-dependent oxidoreductase [Actinomycetota bacterium]
MELGLFVEPQFGGSYERLLKLAQWSETFGLDAFARSDHYLNGDDSFETTDALISFGGLARETSSIRLVSLVSPITFRHPSVMAKSATSLDEMSGGRFTLGVGTGWMESEHAAFGMNLPPLKERFERFEESLDIISAIFAGGGSCEGKHYSLSAERVAPSASDGLQIVVGGSGMNKTPRLAGTYAHEYNSFVTDEETLKARRSTMAEAATLAGRDPADILLSFAGPAFVYEDESDHQAALEERGARRSMTPNEYAAFLDERSVPHGTPAQAREAIDQMASWGVGRYYVQVLSSLESVDLDQMELVFGSLRGT